MVLRIISTIILILSILFLPLWMSTILALVCMIYFSIYFEAVLVFFLSDLLHGVREIRFFNIIFVSSIISAIVLLIIELVKKKLKFYD